MKSTIKILLLFLLCALLFLNNKGGFAQENAPDTLEGVEEKTDSLKPPSDTISEEPSKETTSSEAAPIMEIKRLETEKPLYALELRDVAIGDLFRALAHDYKLNLLVDKEVSGTVTASLSNVSLEEALETIAESQNLILKRRGNIIRISPNLITKIFTLKYTEARGILEPSNSSGAGVSSEGTSSGQQTNTIYDLLSEKGKVFLGKQPNSIIVIDYPPYVERIEAYIRESDQKMTSRMFKLKYLKAADVVGQSTTNTSTTTESVSSSTASSSSGGNVSSSGGSY